MRQQGNEIVMDREEFLVNTLAAGIACQLLAQTSQLEVSGWMEYLSDKAHEQFYEMTPKQRDEMINSWLEISKNV